MKQLISATLSEEAAAIYNNWEKQQKSKILSELIIKEESSRRHIIALQKTQGKTQTLIHESMIRLYLKEGKTPLVLRMNESLMNNVHLYQYDW